MDQETETRIGIDIGGRQAGGRAGCAKGAAAGRARRSKMEPKNRPVSPVAKNGHTAIDGIGRLGTLFTRCVERWLDPEDLTLVQCRGNPQPFDVQQIGGHQLGNLILFGDDTEKALPPLCAIDTEPYSEHEPAAGNRFDKIGMAPLNFC